MKVLSLFSGIGAFEKALDRLNIDYELVAFSEIDKYATKSYCAIHGVDESMNLGDITKVDENSLPKDIDLITYGFPCQDISLAGKQKGLFHDDGSKTRSGLFFEALRIIEATKPKIAIAENVKNLTGKKFKEQFELVLKSLEEAGYSNYWKVLNAKDYGIPQNRERVFIISIRKDIDKGFEFPEPFPLKLRLKDMLDDEVDEKFYLSNKGVNGLLNAFVDGREHKPNLMTNETEYSPTIDTKVGSQTHRSPYIDAEKIKQVGQLYPNSGNPQASRVYDADGISPAMDTCSGGNRMPKVAVAMRGRYNDEGEVKQQLEISDKEYANNITTVQKDSMVAEKIIVREATKKGYAEAVEGDSVNLGHPNSKTRRGRVGKQVSQTLTTSGGNEMAVVVDE